MDDDTIFAGYSSTDKDSTPGAVLVALCCGCLIPRRVSCDHCSIRPALPELLQPIFTPHQTCRCCYAAGKFTESVSEDIIFMLSNNLFRALPPTKAHDQDNVDPDEEEPTLEPAWPHLQVLVH